MNEFFEKYPDAVLPIYKVGEEYFLNHAKDAALTTAVRQGKKLEEITKKPTSKGKAKAEKAK